MFQVLHKIAFEKMQEMEKSDEAKKEAQAEAVEDALEEGGLIP